jgi:chemosensory pili system protein ChpC
MTDIYSLLVPLVEARLIIPRTCVAEVVGFQAPSELPGAASWFIGTMPWSGRAVPLVSFEGACGYPSAAASPRNRIVVLHAIGGIIDVGHFAILAQGFPQLLRISADGVRPDPQRFHAEVPILCQIRMANDTPLVPDLERLEDMIVEEMSRAMSA